MGPTPVQTDNHHTRDKPESASNAEWGAEYDRAAAKHDALELEARRVKFKWYHLVRRTIIPEQPLEKAVLRCLADHAWAGPDTEGCGRVDGACVVLVRTIAKETSLGKSTVRRVLTNLTAWGIIAKFARGRRGGGRGANGYRILPSNPFEVHKAKCSERAL